MSSHPNVMVIVALSTEDSSRKTYRAILAEAGAVPEDQVAMGSVNTSIHGVMESDYDEGFQVGLPEGTVYFVKLATYGYGESVSWDELVAMKTEMATWAQGVCERHRCTFDIFVGANYW